jgi:fructose-bisphosphate aldolase, class I
MTDTASKLRSTASALVAKGKGILAADESDGTIAKRFGSLDIPNTEENRRSYREMLFTTSQVNEFISGVILYDETIRQKASDGTPFPELLKERRITPGIKVDKGAKTLAGSPTEKVTEGLDGLRERLGEYRDMGARFTKWRAVIAIGDGIPTRYCISTNAHALGRYAALSQEAGLVPIVEPEVLIDGDHTIDRCEEVTTLVLQRTFDELFSQRVLFEGMLLKPNMVLSGKDAGEQAPVHEVAERTLRCFRRTVPAAVPGIVFLSGGQSDELATARLNAMNATDDAPWEIAFSYSRALQGPAMKAWGGDAANAEAAQEAFYLRAKLNSAARLGAYSDEMEPVPA